MPLPWQLAGGIRPGEEVLRHSEPSQPRGRVGSEENVAKSLSPACLLLRLLSSLPKLSRRGHRVETGHHVAAVGHGRGSTYVGSGHAAGAGTCNRVWGQSRCHCGCAGPSATRCPSSGTDPRGPPTRAAHRHPGRPQTPPGRAPGWELLKSGSERWLEQRLGTDNC